MKIDYQVKNAMELIKIENKEFRTCCAMDLLFMRVGFNVINGLILILGGDSKEDLAVVYIDNVDIVKMKKNDIEYIKDRYNVEI